MSHDEVFEFDEQSSWGLNWHLPWWLLAAAAIAVVEVTAHPALGIVIFCLKFGMNDWLTALWIRRRDHCRRRASTYTWFLLGSGFIKVFLVSGVVFPVLWLVWWTLVPQADVTELQIALFLGLGGMAASFFVTYFATWLAWKRELKIWLNRDLHRCRAENIWPPFVHPPNQLRRVVDGSSFPAAFMLVLGPVVLLLSLFVVNLPLIACGATLTTLGGGAMALRSFMLRRIVANVPDESWGPALNDRPAEDDLLIQ